MYTIYTALAFSWIRIHHYSIYTTYTALAFSWLLIHHIQHVHHIHGFGALMVPYTPYPACTRFWRSHGSIYTALAFLRLHTHHIQHVRQYTRLWRSHGFIYTMYTIYSMYTALAFSRLHIGHFLNHAQNAPSCMEARLRVSDGLEIFLTWRIV